MFTLLTNPGSQVIKQRLCQYSCNYPANTTLGKMMFQIHPNTSKYPTHLHVLTSSVSKSSYQGVRQIQLLGSLASHRTACATVSLNIPSWDYGNLDGFLYLIWIPIRLKTSATDRPSSRSSKPPRCCIFIITPASELAKCHSHWQGHTKHLDTDLINKSPVGIY